MAPKSDTKQVGTPNATFDPSTFVVTDRPTIKRNRESGIDRGPYHALIRSLEVGQVVEIPAPLDRKAAMSAENIVRESAKDLGLSVSFLADEERNRQAHASGEKLDGVSYYAWFVKGAYKPREKKA